MKFTLNPSSGQDSLTINRPPLPTPIVRPPAPYTLATSITGPVVAVNGGGTILGATVPVCYGYNKPKGYLAFIRRTGSELLMIWVYASGKCPGVGGENIFFNGEPATGGGVAGVSFKHKQGGAAQVPDQWLIDLGSDFEYAYPGQALVLGKIANTRKVDVTSLNLSVITEGRLIRDFRTPLAAEASVTNNVSIAWDILTSTWPWAGVLDPTPNNSNVDIDYDQWVEWANWCDNTSIAPYDYPLRQWGTSVALGAERWAFNGTVKDTNHWLAADAVLANAFLRIVHVDGRFMLRPETDTVPTSVYIPEGRFMGVPTINDADPDTVPTEMEVGYISKVDFSQCKIMYTHAAAKGKHVKLASTIYGCNSQKQAIRWIEQKTKLMRERWTVKMMCGPEIANVAPGDIIEAFLPYGFGDSFIRTMSIISKPELGKYELSGRIVPGSVISVELTNEYTSEDNDGGWETGTPQAPASFSAYATSKKTSRDTYAPIIHAEWSPPVAGPRVRFYELKQGTVIIARVFATKWSGPVMQTGSSVFTINGVSFSGLPGPSPTGLTLNLDMGYVSGIGETPVSGSGLANGGTFIFNDTTGEHELVVMPANYEYHFVTIATGQLTISAVIIDTTNLVRVVIANILGGTPPNISVSTSFTGHIFTVTISGTHTAPLNFSVIVGVQPRASSGIDGGAALPGEEAS